MNLKMQIYSLRKRINDKTLLDIKQIVDEEVERRSLNDTNCSNVKGMM